MKQVLKGAPSWKSPGEDTISNFLYITIHSVQTYLRGFIANVEQGKEELTEADVRAIVISIHKKRGQGKHGKL